MTAAELRVDLMRQIEQADEKLLRIVSSVLEAVKTEYVAPAEEKELTEEMFNALPVPPWAKKRTVEERNRDLMESIMECEQGDFVSLEALEKEIK